MCEDTLQENYTHASNQKLLYSVPKGFGVQTTLASYLKVWKQITITYVLSLHQTIQERHTNLKHKAYIDTKP